MSAPKRKLIEVALPLEKINAAAEGDSPKRKGHPWRLHFWWARRKLVVARAVLFAQLVDDPSVRYDEYRETAIARGDNDPEDSAEQMVAAERQRLFGILERLVVWENIGDEALYAEAHAEIMRSTNNSPPAILDPFAGGGTIPLEAQRLGLEAHASDLNPVAVLINKALVEIPPRFAGREPVFPGAAGERNSWPKSTGLARDVHRYGLWIRDEAQARIGHLYPKAVLPGGGSAEVIGWAWARTVVCPNPACGIETPLVKSWWLGKKRSKEVFVAPQLGDERVQYVVGHGLRDAPANASEGTVGRTGATCVSCGTGIPLNTIRQQGREMGLGARLLSEIAEGNRQRLYLSPTLSAEAAGLIEGPVDAPSGKLGYYPRDLKAPIYGLDEFRSLFTGRQLTAMTTFSDLIREVRARVLSDAVVAGDQNDGVALDAGGSGATAYADAVVSYLGLSLSRASDYWSSLTSWHFRNEQVRNVFSRQAIPMVWDFLEVNPLGSGAGSWLGHLGQAVEVLDAVAIAPAAVVGQASAVDAVGTGKLLSTDPPYYDNVGYSDLSDFFYVWLRRTLRDVYPSLFGAALVPKAEELVANPYRHGGADEAQHFFEAGFEQVFTRDRAFATSDFPITVYYAFKQSETGDDGTGAKGWETILGSIVRSGWAVTATWPFRTETGSRLMAQGQAALASSIVLALRPRPTDAPATDRSGFIQELRAKLPDQLRDLQQGGVAAVDLQQAAIGPGIGIFSKYSKVINPTGQPMSVHDALVQINDILGEVLSGQEGDFDSDSRWCVAWFEEFGFDKGEYGTADTLARAKNTSVDTLARSGAVDRAGSKVWLKDFAALPDKYDPTKDDRISIWEVVLHLAKTLDSVGLDEAARILAGARERGVDVTAAKELAYLLYAIAGRRKLTDVAVALNLLTSSWSDLVTAANRRAEGKDAPASTQVGFDLEALED